MYTAYPDDGVNKLLPASKSTAYYALKDNDLRAKLIRLIGGSLQIMGNLHGTWKSAFCFCLRCWRVPATINYYNKVLFTRACFIIFLTKFSVQRGPKCFWKHRRERWAVSVLKSKKCEKDTHLWWSQFRIYSYTIIFLEKKHELDAGCMQYNGCCITVHILGCVLIKRTVWAVRIDALQKSDGKKNWGLIRPWLDANRYN